MPLSFLIDGYNLIHALGLVKKQVAPRELATARRRLLDFLHEHLGPSGARITVIFDAKRRPRHVPAQHLDGSIFVHYAGKNEEADDVIEKLLAEHQSPQQLVVVSDDRRLRDAATRRRARCFGCQELLDHLERSAAQGPPAQGAFAQGAPAAKADRSVELSAAQVQEWLHEFHDVELPNEFRDFLDPHEPSD